MGFTDTRFLRAAEESAHRDSKGVHVKAYEALAQELTSQGVETVFGLMGDANVPLVAAYVREPQNQFVAVSHEAGAVSGSDGYFRISGRIGVATVTQGPGLTNTLTALTEAVRNRSEILLITGETPLDRTWTQHLDIAAAVAPTGAGYERVYGGASVVMDVRRALRRVRTERRPIVLNFPSHQLQAEAAASPKAAPLLTGTVPGALDDETLERALDIIAGSRRPVILAGRGAADPACRDELLRLAERLRCPVATSLLGRELFDGYPLNLGIAGGLGSSLATDVLMEADTLVTFGAGLNRYTTYTGELTRGKRILQVDTDPEVFGLYTEVDLGIWGTALEVASQVNAALAEAAFEGSGWAQKYVDRLARWTPTDEYVDSAGENQIDARTAVLRLSSMLTPDRNVVTDVGRFSVAAWPRMAVRDPRRFTHTSNFGSIGLGLGTAIGAAIADPGRLTVALLGDGGFMMSCGDLSTAVRYRVPMLIVVFNDRAYGSDCSQLVRYGEDPSLAHMEWPDLADLARAMGATALSVRCLEDLERIPTSVGELKGPCLVDLHLDPSYDSGHW